MQQSAPGSGRLLDFDFAVVAEPQSGDDWYAVQASYLDQIVPPGAPAGALWGGVQSGNDRVVPLPSYGPVIQPFHGRDEKDAPSSPHVTLGMLAGAVFAAWAVQRWWH